jgi:hypothetical protein
MQSGDSMLAFNENRSIGIALTGFGVLFLLLGVLLLFDTVMLILGNVRPTAPAICCCRSRHLSPRGLSPHSRARPALQILFLSGITLLIGTQRTVVFFMRKDRMRGTISFALGIVLVLVGWPIIGMFVEVFGIINLFGSVCLPLPVCLPACRNPIRVR